MALLQDGVLLLDGPSDLGVRASFEVPEVRELPSIRFLNMSAECAVQGGGRLSCVSTYYLGSDSAKWRTDVPNYKSVRYRNVWRGIDIELHEENGKLVAVKVTREDPVSRVTGCLALDMSTDEFLNLVRGE